MAGTRPVADPKVEEQKREEVRKQFDREAEAYREWTRARYFAALGKRLDADAKDWIRVEDNVDPKQAASTGLALSTPGSNEQSEFGAGLYKSVARESAFHVRVEGGKHGDKIRAVPPPTIRNYRIAYQELLEFAAVRKGTREVTFDWDSSSDVKLDQLREVMRDQIKFATTGDEKQRRGVAINFGHNITAKLDTLPKKEQQAFIDLQIELKQAVASVRDKQGYEEEVQKVSTRREKTELTTDAKSIASTTKLTTTDKTALSDMLLGATRDDVKATVKHASAQIDDIQKRIDQLEKTAKAMVKPIEEMTAAVAKIDEQRQAQGVDEEQLKKLKVSSERLVKREAEMSAGLAEAKTAITAEIADLNTRLVNLKDGLAELLVKAKAATSAPGADAGAKKDEEAVTKLQETVAAQTVKVTAVDADVKSPDAKLTHGSLAADIASIDQKVGTDLVAKQTARQQPGH